MLIKMVNFPDGSDETVQISEEQETLLEFLQERGALIPDFQFEEISIKYLC